MHRAAIILPLLMTALSAWAADEVGKWSWSPGGSIFVAQTTGESGERLGETCEVAEKRCSWVLTLKRSCTPRTTYAVLASSDLGGSSFQLTCIGPSADDAALFDYSIGEFDNIDDLLARARQVGFALPLQPDRFYTVKFDMSGAKPAVDAMRKAAIAEMQKAK